MLVMLFSEVHPFGSVPADLIAVDIVTSQEVAEKKPEPPPPPKVQPSDSLDFVSKAASSGAAPAPSIPEQAAMPPQTAAPSPGQQQAAARPQAPAASPSPPSPVYKPPEPDLSIKYQVLLGLPPELPPLLPQGRSDEAFDGPASKAADIASSLVAEFRRHLKTCSKLPGSIAPSDKVRIVLRVLMTPDGKLATEPVLVEASASAKGPILMQGAISALQACQPYAMLPADRYGEWKVLDLGFTPQDF